MRPRAGFRLRTGERIAVARAKGKLRGEKPKLSDRQSLELRPMHDTGPQHKGASPAKPLVGAVLWTSWRVERTQT